MVDHVRPARLPVVTRQTLLILILINILTYVYQSVRRPHFVDFGEYYVAGVTARSTPKLLYDRSFQQEMQSKILHDDAFFPFYHPPLEIPIFEALSRLPLRASLQVWRLLSCLLILASGLLLADALALDRLDTLLLSGAIYPAAYCVSLGQDSALLLLVISAWYFLLKRNHDVLAGIVLAASLFKPQLAIILALALLAVGRIRCVLAWVAASIPVTAFSLLYMQPEGVRRFLFSMREGEKLAPADMMVSIRGLVALVAGEHARLALVSLVLCLGVSVYLWRRRRSLDFAISTAICVASFAGLHVFAYDLILLLIPFAIVAARLEKKDTLLVAILTSAPLYLALSTLKLSALAILPTVMLTVVCFRIARPGNETSMAEAQM